MANANVFSDRRQGDSAWHELESRVQQRTAQLAQANEQIRIRAGQQEAVVEFGRRALAGEDLAHLLPDAGELIARQLEVEMSFVLEHADPESGQLLLRACYGWAGEIGTPITTTEPDTLAGFVLHSGQPVVISDLALENRFAPPQIMLKNGLVSGITVVIPGEERPFGMIGAYTSRARDFTQDDLNFVQSVANVLAAAVERHRADGIVRLAREAAVKANDAKLDFLSRMSHELRTPLNAILGFGQLLEIEVLEDRQHESVDRILIAGRHLLHLVDGILDISLIESGNFTFALEPLAVADLLHEAIDLMRPLTGEGELAIAVTLAEPAARFHVLANLQSVRQVLLNLLSNAVKYNRPGGRVTVSSRPAPDGRSVRLEIADTGIGIPAESLSRLFTPFDRLGAEQTSVEGSGIGLALSKRLIDGQGGKLGVDSVDGEGSTFWIDLPVAAEPLEEPPLVRAHWITKGSSLPPLESAETDAIPAAETGGRPPRTILQIEDDEQNRRLMELLLQRRPGLRLLTASTGKEGLELARMHRPDLILLDMYLTDTSGEQVLKALRIDILTRDTPVVVVSADASEVRQKNLRKSGANDYLTKPFGLKEFLQVIDHFLGRAVVAG